MDLNKETIQALVNRIDVLDSKLNGLREGVYERVEDLVGQLDNLRHKLSLVIDRVSDHEDLVRRVGNLEDEER